jgi:hypothetical protein
VSVAAIAGSLVLTGLGGLVWSLFFRYVAKRRAMKRWPLVTGTVLGHRVRGGGVRQPSYVDYEVAFRFADVDRVVWCTSATSSGYGRGTSRDVVERQAGREHPTGSEAAVHVNPGRPEEACLALPEPHMLAMLATGGTVLLGAAAVPVLTAWLGLPEEIVMPLFFLTLAAGLVAVAVTAGIALFRR